MRIFVLNVKIEIMTRKDIEKARSNYIKGLCDAKKLSNSAEIDIACNGFVDGAEWRITSIWHTMEEEPQVYGEYENKICPQIPCLVLGYLNTGYGYGVRYWNVAYKVWDDEECDDYECSKDNIEKWCYLDDLLPTK